MFPRTIGPASCSASQPKIPLPAKLTLEALPPIDLRAEFGPEPDVDEVYDHIVRVMQETLDALAAERRFPVLG